MISDWIDAVQNVWAGIQGDGFDYVRAPLMVKKREYPSAIDAKDLGLHPIALSMVGETMFQYSMGGPNLGFYQGVTEFHVAPNLDRSAVPDLLKWSRLIVRAAAANMKLGGLVELFVLQERDDQINGPLALQYGDETEHWGFLVYWEVKEQLNTAITVATG
jgi:hypothetical protein